MVGGVFEILLRRVYQLIQQEKWAEAHRIYQDIVRKSIRNAQDLQAVGFIAIELGDYPRAVKLLKKAIRMNGDDPQGYLLLGVTKRRQKKWAAARDCFQKALRLRPGWIDALNNLAITLEDMERYEEAIACLEEGLRLTPDDPDLLNALGSVQCAVGKPAVGIEYYRRAVAENPDYAPFRSNLAQALLRDGQWKEGWELYQARLALPCQVDSPAVQAPCWNGEPLAGKKILIWNEQGFGDTIQFVRYVPDLIQRGAGVYLRVQPALRRLLKQIPGVVEILLPGDEMPDVDYHSPLLDLPRFWKPEAARGDQFLPYLQDGMPDALRLDKKSMPCNIGLVWSGNSRHPEDFKRSIPPRKFLPLLNVKNVGYYSLQVGGRAKALIHRRLFQLEAYLDDFADTAAVIQQLDLIISVDTAVAHLAGAMGKKIWMLVDYAGDWRWMNSCDKTPWYPSMTIYRQSTPGDWDEVLKRVAQGVEQQLKPPL